MDNQEPPGRFYDDNMAPPPQMNGYPDDGQRSPSINDGSRCSLFVEKKNLSPLSALYVIMSAPMKWGDILFLAPLSVCHASLYKKN